MILYFINHPAFLLRILILHMTKHPAKSFTIITKPFLAESQEFLNTKATIISVNELVAMTSVGVEKIKEEIISYYDSVFQKTGINIFNYEKVYYFVDRVSSFSLYLTLKDVPFSFIEGNSNSQYIKYCKGEENLRCFHNVNISTDYLYLAKKYHTISCANSVCNEVILDKRTTEIIDNKTEKTIFDFLDVLKKLNDHQKSYLFEIYDVNELKMLCGKKFDCFFANSFAVISSILKISGTDWFIFLSIFLFFDFYLSEDKLSHTYVKFHPNDSQNNNAKIPIPIISNIIPAELFEIVGVKIDTAYFIASSSQLSIEQISNKTVRLGVDYYKNLFYMSLPQLYFLMNISLFFNEFKRIGLVNINNDQVKKYIEMAFPDLTLPISDKIVRGDGAFTIIDMKNASLRDEINLLLEICFLHYQNHAIALINYDYDKKFEQSVLNSPRLNRYRIVIDISIEKVRKDTLFPLQSQKILIYVKQASLQNKLKTVSINKNLKICGVNIKYIIQ